MILSLVFIYRSYVLPEYEFEVTSEVLLARLTVQFCKDWQRVFGEQNMLYNLHMLSHLPHIRQRKGPINNFSCYPFESSYSVVKNSQHPGTESLGKQAILGVFAKLVAKEKDHRCGQSLKISTQETSKCNDTILALGPAEFIQVTSISDDGTKVTGNRIVIEDFWPRMTVDPQGWMKVGVSNFREVSDESVTVDVSDLYGKGILCHGIITSVPKCVLFDH